MANQNEQKSHYQKAREAAKLSIKTAAENMCGTSEYKLRRLENGTTNLQPDDVVVMAECYGQPELRNYYCTHDCPIGQLDAPCAQRREAPAEALETLEARIAALTEPMAGIDRSPLERLHQIFRDGTISAGEEAQFQKIYNMIEAISAQIETLQQAWERIDAPVVRKNPTE